VLHLAQKTPGRRNTAFTVYLGAGVVLVTLAILAWRQTHIWHDSTSLWSHTVAVTPDSVMANNALGKELSRQRRFDEAVPYFKKVIELRPGDALNRASLAAVYLN